MEKSSTSGPTAPEPDDTNARLHAQIAELQAELGRLAAAVGLLGQAGAEALRDKAEAGAATLKDKAEADLQQAAQTAEQVLAGATDYARRKPVSALAIAAGIGLVLGLLFGRR